MRKRWLGMRAGPGIADRADRQGWRAAGADSTKNRSQIFRRPQAPPSRSMLLPILAKIWRKGEGTRSSVFVAVLLLFAGLAYAQPNKSSFSRDKERSMKARRMPQRKSADLVLHLYDTLPPLPSILAPPAIPDSALCDEERTKQPKRQRYIDFEGIILGDFHLAPNLVLATDGRYDDINTRERMLRSELDTLEARRRGEIKEDPLSLLLRQHSQRCFARSDPGFRFIFTLHQLLQGGLYMPNLIQR